MCSSFPSPIAAAFSADNDLQIGFITEETILDPCKPKIHKIDSINKTKIVAGNVLPIDCNGCCNIVKMKFCALLKLVISKPILTKLKIIKIIATGIKASNGLATFWGTESGNLIVHPFWTTNLKISTAKQVVIIAKNNPDALKLSSGNPFSPSSVTKAVLTWR